MRPPALWYCAVGLRPAGDRRRRRRAADRRLAGLLVVRGVHDGADGRSSPTGLSRSRRWTTPSSSSAPAARTRSTRRPSSPAGTGTSSAGRRSGSSCRASTATTGCTRGARRSPASRPTRRATAARSSTRSSPSASTTPRRLGALFERSGHEIAAFIGEPVVGAGGVYPPEPSYWAEVQRLCREHDVLLIADEVITGFGRTGRPVGLAALRHRAGPGHLRQGRDLGLPAARRRARRRRGWRRRSGTAPTAGPMFVHGYTYTGHAAACAAADGEPRHHRGRGPRRPGRGDGGAVRRGHPPPRGRRRSSARSGPSASPRPSPSRRTGSRPTQRSRPGSSARRSATGSPRASCAATPCRSPRPSRSPTEEIDVLVDGLGAALEDVAAAG